MEDRQARMTITEGIVLIILGVVAVVLPHFFTFGIELLIGVLLIVSGLVQSWRAFAQRNLSGSLWSLVFAALAIAAGILLLIYPRAGVLILTLILTVFFFIEGVSKLLAAARMRQTRFWIWYLLSGIVAIVLAAVVWAGWPSTANWFIGLLVGINLILFGCARIALASSLRK